MLLGFQQRLRLHALVPSEVWYYNGSFVEFQSENKLQLGYTAFKTAKLGRSVQCTCYMKLMLVVIDIQLFYLFSLLNSDLLM